MDNEMSDIATENACSDADHEWFRLDNVRLRAVEDRYMLLNGPVPGVLYLPTHST